MGGKAAAPARLRAALPISARREVEDLREGGCRWDTEYPRDLWRLRALAVPGQQAAIRRPHPQRWLKALAERWARWRAAAGGRSDAIYQGIRAITGRAVLVASKVLVQGLGKVDRVLPSATLRPAARTGRQGRSPEVHRVAERVPRRDPP